MLRWKTKFLTRSQAYDFEMRRQQGEVIYKMLNDAEIFDGDVARARADMKRYEKDIATELLAKDILAELNKGGK